MPDVYTHGHHESVLRSHRWRTAAPGVLNCVGVDLAWGRRARTGLCAVALDGRVAASTTVLTDSEILDWMRVEAPAARVVGFDAPLIVDNLTGRRRCETLLSRAFGPQKAGAHSSNRSMPAFADGGRALFLARTLDLRTVPAPIRLVGAGPATPDPGLAVEVYPHAALVATFGLAERPVYKAGRGRSVETRRLGLGLVIGLLESLADGTEPFDVTANPRWPALAGAVARAVRHFELEAVEDEIDAHVCAYVALLAWRDQADGGQRVRVLGDWSEGAVVTPVDERQLTRLVAIEIGSD